MTKAEIEEINDELQVENARLRRQLETANGLLQTEMERNQRLSERVQTLDEQAQESARQLKALKDWASKLSGVVEKIGT